MLEPKKNSCSTSQHTIAALLLLFNTVSVADESYIAEQLCIDNNAQCLSRTLAIRGDYFKALLVAYYADISKILQKISNEESTDAGRFVSLLENNDFSIKMQNNNYIVQFGPTLRGKGRLITGGDTRYVIDGKDFKILKITRMR